MTETLHAEKPQTDRGPLPAARHHRSGGARTEAGESQPGAQAGEGLVLQRAAARAAGGRRPPAPRMLLSLQRTAGNAAVARIAAATTLQRCPCGGETADGEECTECREGHTAVQRQPAGSGATDPSVVHEVLRSAGQPLDPAVRADLEGHLRHDFSNVRVHHGGRASESARMLNARAYTAGSHVVFDDGEFRPGSSSGRALLAHELTHVVQQSSASTTTASSSQGLAVDPDPALEAEARAAEKGVASASARVARSGASSIQRRIQVAGPDRIPPHLTRTTMTPADVAATPPELVGQTAGAVVTRLLNRLCPSGGWQVDSSGMVTGSQGFCGGDAQAAAPQVTGCGCLCELTSGGSLNVQLHVTDRSVDTTGAPADPPLRTRGEGMATTDLRIAAGQRVYQVAISGRNNVSGSVRGRGDTGAPADTLGHQALRDPPWLILGHEMCGHVRKDLSQPSAKHFKHTMSEDYDTSALDVENALRREQSTATDNLGIRFGEFRDPSGDLHRGLVYKIKFGARVVTLHRKFNIPYEHMMSDPVDGMSRGSFLPCNQGPFDPFQPQRVFAHVYSYSSVDATRFIPAVCSQYHFQPDALVYLEGVFAHRTIAGETKTSIAAMWNVSLPLLATANTDISDLHTYGDTQVLPPGKVVIIPYDRAAASAFFGAGAGRVTPATPPR
jgi:hypothetical protein